MRLARTGMFLVILTSAPRSQSGPLVFVSNEGDRSVSVLDLVRGTTRATIGVPGRPRGIRVTPDGRHVLVALSDERPHQRSSGDAIVAIDVATLRIGRRFDGGTDPEQFAISPDGRTLIAANEDAGTATVTSLSDGRPLATLTVGIEPEGAATSPDGRWAAITAETSNSVSIIDARANRIATHALVDPRPRSAIFAPDSRTLWVTAEIGGTVSQLDVPSGNVLATISLGDESKPVGVEVSRDGRRVYVASGGKDAILVVDPVRQRVARTVPVGKRPWGVALSRDGHTLVAANGGTGTVSVVDTRTLTVKRTITVGSRPWGVAIVEGALPRP